MTDEELKAIDDKAGVYERDGMQFVYMPDVRALVAEVRRLKGLIEDLCGKDRCPWCDSEQWIDLGERTVQGGHYKNCPAFTESGEVK